MRRWRRGAPPALSELERALKRTRREPAPGTTLHALEPRFAGTRPPPPATYGAAREPLPRRARAGPTRAQRRGLRSELGRGGGLLGRLRAWWALHAALDAARGLQSQWMDDVYDLYQRGMALLEDGHFHQATIPLAKARDLDPEKTSIREALGRAYFRSGNFEQARVEFEAVVERAPTNDYALFCLGRSLMQLGRNAEARKPLTLAGEHEPAPPRLRDLPRPRAQSGLKETSAANLNRTAFRGR